MGKKASIHVISHTHWDREWYLTFEQFRIRLVDLINHLIELLDNDPEFKVFHLDGQLIVLEDYYAIHPENKERLEHYIREGRILIGPWYLQNDEYLTSGEATIRNLQIGIAMARDIAEEMKVGYLPDQFGNISQMPQILRGFGIGNAIFARGYDNFNQHKEQEFLWEGADGSRVTAIFMPNWYNNAQRLPEEPHKAKKALDLIRSKIDERRQTSNYLLMNGVDHLEAQENLSGILMTLRSTLDEGEEILHTTLPEHVRRVEAELTNPAVQTGEMRDGDDYHILAGTLSARVYLKQVNVTAQDLLEKWIEPLSTWLFISGLGAYPEAYLKFLWKELMKNHPHDSICGCSQDEVHAHMMDRFASVTEAGEEVWRRQARLLAQQINTEGMGEDDQLLVVFNPSPVSQGRWMEAQVDFQEKDAVESFSMFDADGREVDYAVIGREKTRKQRLSPINLPTELAVERWTVQWLAEEVPGQGYTSYRIIPHRSKQVETKKPPMAEEPVMENEHLAVRIAENGSLSIKDKHSGLQFDHQLQLVNDADAGDLYVFKYLPGSASLTTEGLKAQIRRLPSTNRHVGYEIIWNWMLPKGLEAEGERRSEERVEYPIKAEIYLTAGSKQVEVRLELNNSVKDHRLRARFPLPAPVDETVAGGQFDVVRRSRDEGTEYARNANTHPNWKWVSAANESGGIAIFNKGLHEYELMNGGSALDLTLVRSVGTIFGRPNPLPHENDDNPQGQCPGKHRMEFALRPFGSGTSYACLAREAEAYHHGLRPFTIPVREDKWAQGRPWVQDSEIADLFVRPHPNADKERLPRRASFVEVKGEGAVLSAVKRQHGGTGTVIRFYNALESQDSVSLTVHPSPAKAWKADLLEQPLEELAVCEGSITVEAGGKEIVTILIQL